MDAQLTRKLNSIDWTDYLHILRHIRSRLNGPVWYPDNVNTNLKKRTYYIRFEHFFETQNGIEYVNNGIQLIVVRPNDRDAKLKQIWYNQNMYGAGILLLYKKVSSMYLGISRKYCIAYLRKQQAYQIYTKKVTIKNPVRTFENWGDMWYIDEIEMNYAHTNNYKYIFSAIDAATRLIYIRAITHKNHAHLALADILAHDVPLGLKPSVIHSDRGREFIGQFSQYLRDNNINQTFSDSATPVVQIESANKRIRNQLSKIHTFNANNNWLDYIPMVQANLNTKTQLTLERTLIREARNNANAPQHLNYPVGANVRVHLSQFYPEYRKRMKEKHGKLNHIEFSVVYFVIHEVVFTNNMNALPLYKLNYVNGQPVNTPEGQQKLFKHKHLRVINVAATQNIRLHNVQQATAIMNFPNNNN